MDIVTEAKAQVAKLKNVKTSQIRKFLVAVNQINNRLEIDGWEKVKEDVPYLRVKLAYQMGRFPEVKKGFEGFDEKIKTAYQSPENYKKFAKLVEAIVAYHKYENNDGENKNEQTTR